MSRIVDVLMSRAAFVAIVVFALVYFVYDVGGSLAHGVPLRCWNWLNITITFALILALYLARRIDGRMRDALHELWLQGTIPEASDRAALQQRILKGRANREAGCAFLIMLVMISAYAWSEAPYLHEFKTVMVSPQVDAGIKWQLAIGFFGAVALGVLSGLVAGAFFGRLATYGSMATVLADPQTRLNVRPGHFDGANGLKPVGDFYLYQALLTAIPLVWLAGWALALPWYFGAPCSGVVDPDYIWRVRWQFYGQWLVVATFTYFGFVRPVFALRRRLIVTRDDLLKTRTPQIETEIVRLKGALSGISGDDGRGAIETRIHDLAREHWAIRNMNCWPMNRSTFHKYAPVEIVSNVAPVLVGPLLSFTDGAVSGQAAGPSDFIGALTSFLRALFL
jgi:hypothetical protein